MARYRRQILGLDESFWAKAARAAVFRPLLDHQPAVKAELGNVRRQYADLQRLWLGRLDELKKVKWQPPGFEFLRECPPFGVRGRWASYPCSRSLICPFCYGRRVIDLYMRFEQAVYKTHQKRVEQAGAIHTIEPTPCKLVEVTAWQSWEQTKPPGLILHSLRGMRRIVVDAVPRRAAALLIQLYPMNGQWQMSRRHLIMVDPETAVPKAYEEAGLFVTEHTNVTRNVIVKAVSSVFQYPKAMMLGPADEVAQILQASSKFRCFSFFAASNRQPKVVEADPSRVEKNLSGL